MDNNTLVSIIVPIYKVEKYLDECVESLVKQTYPNLEIILVDDGSPDNCPAMCDAWKARDARIHVVHKANGGVSDARNAGMHVATGKWLLFIDSDDTIPINFVNSLVSAATDDNRLAVSGTIRFTDILPKCTSANNAPVSCGKNLIDKRGGLFCCGALYSRALVNNLGLQFDTLLRNVEDVVWNGIYLRYVSEVIFVDVPYFYRINPTSITSRCIDYRWQIASWIAARRSLMNWFSGKVLTSDQHREVAGMYRHCQNNIYAECVAGNISFAELHTMECEPSSLFDQTLVSVPERFMRFYCPRLYYAIYTFLLRLKKVIG